MLENVTFLLEASFVYLCSCFFLYKRVNTNSELIGNSPTTTTITPVAATQPAAAEAPTSTTQSAASAAAVTTTSSAQSSVSVVTSASTGTIQSDGLATATTASAASGSSMNSGSEATQGEVNDVVEMPFAHFRGH